MANDYLTLEEVCERLGRTVEQVNGLVAEGRLSETRDGEAVYYRQSEVEQIAAKEGSSIVDLAASEDLGPGEEADSFASALSELADSSSGLELLNDEPVESAPAEAAPAELTIDDIPEDLPAAPKVEGPADLDMELGEAQIAPEVPDLGLSGSSIISLEASPEETAVAGQAAAQEFEQPAKKVGISVFDDDELEIDADPMGETHIAASVEELDSVGSGSGLLDLTRESDDTSLDPDLLEVISPSEATETATEEETMEDAPVEDSGVEAAVTEEQPFEPVAAMAPAPRVAAGATAGETPMNLCALMGVLGLALVGLAATAQIQGVWPEFMNFIARGMWHGVVFGGVALIALILGILGIVAGKK